MAKLGGAPHSGSSQWYFNVSSSAAALATITNNGGFTVFGKLTESSLAVMDAIHSKPIANYTVSLDGSNRSIAGWPTLQIPQGAQPAAADYIKIVSASLLSDQFTYTVTGDSNPGVVIATVSATGRLDLVRQTAGSTTLEITATDLNGNSVTTNFSVIVEGTEGFDAANDADKDGLALLL